MLTAAVDAFEVDDAVAGQLAVAVAVTVAVVAVKVRAGTDGDPVATTEIRAKVEIGSIVKVGGHLDSDALKKVRLTTVRPLEGGGHGRAGIIVGIPAVKFQRYGIIIHMNRGAQHHTGIVLAVIHPVVHLGIKIKHPGLHGTLDRIGVKLQSVFIADQNVIKGKAIVVAVGQDEAEIDPELLDTAARIDGAKVNGIFACFGDGLDRCTGEGFGQLDLDRAAGGHIADGKIQMRIGIKINGDDLSDVAEGICVVLGIQRPIEGDGISAVAVGLSDVHRYRAGLAFNEVLDFMADNGILVVFAVVPPLGGLCCIQHPANLDLGGGCRRDQGKQQQQCKHKNC